MYGCGDLSDSVVSLGDLYSYCPLRPNLGYGFPGEIAADRGVSEVAHLANGLSSGPSLLVFIGSDNGLRVGCRCSSAILDVGETSLAEELKFVLGYPRGGVVSSDPLRGASSFCNNDLSYAWAVLRNFSWTELWKARGSWYFDLVYKMLVGEMTNDCKLFQRSRKQKLCKRLNASTRHSARGNCVLQ